MTKLLKNFVAGRWVETAQTFVKTSPFDGRHIADVCEADETLVAEAVAAGREVSIGTRASEWGRLPLKERANALKALTAELARREHDLIEAEVGDTGRSRFQSRNGDGLRATNLFSTYAELALGIEHRSRFINNGPGAEGIWYTNRLPKGVIACICPWNMPLLMAVMKVAPALIMGNAAILKPSEESPSSATVLAEAIEACGFPPGVFSLVHGFGAGSAGGFLTSHPDVDAITFTGESGTGAAIIKVAANGLREVSLELGGKNPIIVFDDANMDPVIEGVTRSAFFNCGQICFCTERAYVHASRFDEFVDRLAQVARSIVIGEPDHQGFSIGPLISKKHQAKVSSLLDTVTRDGGRFVAGGGIPSFGDARDQGAFIEPSVAVGLAQDAQFLRNEVFGPVVHVAPFETEAEAIALANDTPFGLAASVWTSSIDRAHRVPPQIRAGHVWVNSWQFRDLISPLSGAGQSGIGEQSGRNSLEFCSLSQTVTTRVFTDEEQGA